MRTSVQDTKPYAQPRALVTNWPAHPPLRETGRISTPSILNQLIARDGCRCHYCGKTLYPDAPEGTEHYPTRDHVVPRSQRGKHALYNLVLACRSCNNLKGAQKWHLNCDFCNNARAVARNSPWRPQGFPLPEPKKLTPTETLYPWLRGVKREREKMDPPEDPAWRAAQKRWKAERPKMEARHRELAERHGHDDPLDPEHPCYPGIT